MKIYRYIYYKLYCLILKRKDSDRAKFSAVLIFTLLIWVNICTIPLFCIVVLKKDMFSFIDISSFQDKIYALLLFFTFFTINYVFLCSREKYLKIYNEFSNEVGIQKVKKTIFFWLYFILTIGIPVFIAFTFK
jgi:hypothetical protein